MTQKAENNLYQEIIESLPEVFWKASPTFDQILYVSPAYETIWGQPREKLYKNSWAWMDSIIPQDKDRVAKVFEGLTKDVSVVMLEYTIIDDFGTEYTSLSYLKKFRIDKLKIDKSFIHGIPKDRGDSTITHAIIALAHAMYVTVVAEGVETQEQLDFLKKAGCDEAQGYFYARPQAADEISAMLKKRNKPT